MAGNPPKTITLDNLNTFLSCLKAEKGEPNGFASLDSNGKIPASQLSEDVANITVTADEFSPNKSYQVDDYVIYEGDLYVCTANHSGAWDSTHFVISNITNELNKRQNKTLDTPITVENIQYTTVEGAINAINNNTVKSSKVGTSNGIASLDSTGRVPSTQLPSYVDDVEEYASTTVFPAQGESSKIYVALDTNKIYRWGGTGYVEISESLAIGETATTAFAGNRGKAIEDKIPSNASSSNKLATIADIPIVSGFIPTTEKGAPNGVAALDATGKVSASQLPSMSGGSGIKDFTAKTWTGLTEFEGKYVWSDGTNTYYSDLHTQYVLNKETSEWETTTWYLDNGSTFYFSGDNIWTDGDDIYYDTVSYILNKSTLAWEKNTWSGQKIYSVNKIWSDGNNTYYSEEGNNYVLNKQTSTWENKTWYGLTNINGASVWTDGDNIYVNDFENDYVLNKQTSTWEAKTWQGFSGVSGLGIWTDKSNIYYSNGTRQYILDRSSSTWISKTWKGLNDFYAEYIWTDGSDMYYSKDNAHYILYSIGIDVLLGQPDGIATLDSNGKVPSSQLTIGQANGIASLDSNGKVPASQLPTDTGLMIKKATFKIYSRGGSEYDTKDLIRELGDFIGELLYNYDSSTHKYGTRKAELMYFTLSDEMDEYKNHNNSNEYWFNPYDYNRYSSRLSSVDNMLKNIKYTTVDSNRYGASSRPTEVVYMYQSPLDKYDNNSDFVRLLQVRIILPDIGIRYSNGDINNNAIASIYSGYNFISLSQLCYDSNTGNYVEIGTGNYISYRDIADTSLYQTITVYYHDL